MKTKIFKRYATVNGYPCRRFGLYTAAWRWEAEGYPTSASTRACSITITEREQPIPAHRPEYFCRESELRSLTRQHLAFSHPPPDIVSTLADGDVEACRGCTYCQQFIYHCAEEGLKYNAFYNINNKCIYGTASLTCLNPEVYLQDEIVWNLRFHVVSGGNSTYLPYVIIAGTDVPHPHGNVGKVMCLNRNAMDLARILFLAGEIASGLRVILEAMRYIIPHDVASHELQDILGIELCPCAQSHT